MKNLGKTLLMGTGPASFRFAVACKGGTAALSFCQLVIILNSGKGTISRPPDRRYALSSFLISSAK